MTAHPRPLGDAGSPWQQGAVPQRLPPAPRSTSRSPVVAPAGLGLLGFSGSIPHLRSCCPGGVRVVYKPELSPHFLWPTCFAAQGLPRYLPSSNIASSEFSWGKTSQIQMKIRFSMAFSQKPSFEIVKKKLWLGDISVNVSNSNTKSTPFHLLFIQLSSCSLSAPR